MEDDAFPRPVWTGNMSLGLVSIPVRAVPMTRGSGRPFQKDSQGLQHHHQVLQGLPLGDVVPLEEVAYGYKVDGNEYVVL
jgi:non-homologous end joining protein Ku